MIKKEVFLIILLFISALDTALYLIPKDSNFSTFETIQGEDFDIKKHQYVKKLIVVDTDTPEPALFEGTIKDVGLPGIIIYGIIGLIWLTSLIIALFLYIRSLFRKYSRKSKRFNLEIKAYYKKWTRNKLKRYYGQINGLRRGSSDASLLREFQKQ